MAVDDGEDLDIKVTAAQRAYLAAMQSWLDRGAEDSDTLDRELVDITRDDMLDEADPALRDRILERETPTKRGRRNRDSRRFRASPP